jgi:hypothetical protein
LKSYTNKEIAGILAFAFTIWTIVVFFLYINDPEDEKIQGQLILCPLIALSGFAYLYFTSKKK